MCGCGIKYDFHSLCRCFFFLLTTAVQPFLAAHFTESTNSLLCARVIADKGKQTIGTSGLSTIEEKAALWAKVQVPDGDEPHQEFTCVEEKIKSATTRSFQAHSSCRLMFRTHLERKQKKYGSKEDTGATDVDSPELEECDKQEEKRTSGRMGKRPNFICFICNTKTSKDTKPYTAGGLGQCSEERSSKKPHNQVTKKCTWRQVWRSRKETWASFEWGQSYDVFAVDVYTIIETATFHSLVLIKVKKLYWTKVKWQGKTG